MPASANSRDRAADGACRRVPLGVSQRATIETQEPGRMEAGMVGKKLIRDTFGNGSHVSVIFSGRN